MACWLLLLLYGGGMATAGAQGGRRDYDRDGVYVPDVRNTYVYGDRRYGYGGDNRYHYQDGQPTPVPLPGVLAGWRPDLQGRERPNSRQLPRDVQVNTGCGPVQGFRVYLYDDPRSGYRPGNSPVERELTNISVFLGIPYAQPPVNEGRFKPPRRHCGWQSLQAVDFGPACPQPVRYIGQRKGIRDMDEDCLYLNIYTPMVESGRAQLYPVMFYIHGGDFTHGASNLFQPHMMVGFYDVVVVTINYRLGALGFLSTGDEHSPGNYGILDQAMALQWVYENIVSFNGDHSLITVFGPGAGAASAGLLAIAPRTRDMISKVIAQSGSPLADWALITDRYRAQNTSRVFGMRTGCNIESAWQLIICLKNGRSAADLGNTEFQPQVGMFPWAPVLDGNFSVPSDSWHDGWKESDWHLLWNTPEELIQRGMFNQQLQYMSGVTTQEASYLIYNNESLAPDYNINADFFKQKVRELVLRYNYTLNSNGVYEAIKHMYTYWPDPNNTWFIRQRYIEMMSDFLYVAPFDHMTKLLVQRQVPVYQYVLNTTVEAFRHQEWRKVPHNIEHYFLTGAPFMDIEFFPRRPLLDRQMWTDNDRNMSHLFMKAFTNFARYGNPTHTEILGLHFEKAIIGQLKYLNINTTFNSSVWMNYRQTESAFWTMYLPTVIGNLVPTYPPSTEFWWEPKEPLQIAFWTVSGACLMLIVIVVICCILWRNAKRLADRYFSGDIMLRDELGEAADGIENRSATHVPAYRDTPPPKLRNQNHQNVANMENRLGGSMPSLRTASNSSLKEAGAPRNTPMANKKVVKPTHVEGGVPQTQV